MRYSEASTDAAWFHLSREALDPAVIATFTVGGEPVSKARARFTGYGSKTRAYTPAKTLAAEARVKAAFLAAAGDHLPDAEATYGLTAIFFNGTRQRRDIDNMLKLLLDGLNGIAWHDDTNVVEISGRKCIETREDARTEVVVYLVGAVQRLSADCLQCGESYVVFPGNRKKFCTTACANAAKRKPRPPCARCGEPIRTRGSTYCSSKCMGLAKRKAAR